MRAALAAFGHHHGERLGLARLQPAQPRHRRFVARVAEEMEAAEALERDDAAGAEAVGDGGDLRVEPAGRSSRQAIGSAWKRRFDGSA